jgi:hypothetical protein
VRPAEGGPGRRAVPRRRRRSGLAIAAALALALALALAGAASAKPAKRRAASHKPAPSHTQERSAVSTSADSPADGAGERSAEGAPSTDDRPPGETKPGAGGGKVKTKTYTFGAMDVEGKLKTPQLLYFLNRVKLELDMSAPDKRSFMKELGQSADDKSL